jgi:hypothetical protein
MKPATLESEASESAPSRGRAATEVAHSTRTLRDEPRTGVVRKVETTSDAAERPTARQEKRAFASGIVRRALPATPASETLDRAKSRAWRCLEWAAVPEKAPRSEPPAPRVSIAQITTHGALMRQSGPDETLPETAEFMHRVSTLVAQGLGFRRCRALCLRGSETALSVAQAGANKVVGVSGPLGDMTNVLRRMDLE